jgi:hypothetical protein
MQRTLDSERIIIDAGWLDKGLYFIELSGRNKRTVTKISKQ